MRLISLVIIISLTGCQRSHKNDNTGKTTVEQAEKVLANEALDVYTNEYMVLGTLYHQQSAEYRALCYQAYNLGRLMLDKDLADKSIEKHRIVVLDIDETILDNSPYQAQCIIDDINYPTRWDEWCNKSSAKPIAGSLEFLNYARDNGVNVYYITNRKEHLRDATLKNLKEDGFPEAENDHLLMRTNENSKESRRKQLSDKYHISLLFGDNLNDFTNVFESLNSNTGKMNEVDRMKAEFGSRFIVLPNSMYGDWETALYDMNKKQPDSIKFQLRHNGLKGF